jgi:hypothetical protein
MPHTVKVDLSAKVEQWSRDTAVAFSDGIKGTVLINKKVKKAARNWLHHRYPNRSLAFYTYLLLAILIYMAIKPHLPKIQHIEIDDDYPGVSSHDRIKNLLLNFLQIDDPSLRGNFISFREVRGSAADLLARRTYKGELETEREVSLNDIKGLF